MKLSQKGIEVLIEFEGFREDAYLDVVGTPTIGFGFTHNVKMGDRITFNEAKARLQAELSIYEKGVLSSMTVPPTQQEFDACVSLAFNIGIAGFRRSSVLKAHNRGDKQAAARAFGLWNKAGGRVWAGLTRRRAAEATLYLTRDAYEDPYNMPQRIDPERRMTESTINRASVAAGGTAAVAAVSEVVQTANEIKQGAGQLGDWLVPGLLLLVVVMCGYIIYERVSQRREGFA